MSVLDKAKAHFAQLRGEMQSIHVPEWDETIYFKPMNLKEQGQILSLVDQRKYEEAWAVKLITMARFENGNKMFTPSQKVEIIRSVDPVVLSRICEQMEPIRIEDMEKNSEQIQS